MLKQLRDLVERKEKLDEAFESTVWEHPLATSYLKVLRADNNLETLDALFKGFLESQPYSIRSRLYLASGKYFIFPTIQQRFLDKWWGTLVGDVVHNLRSALEPLRFSAHGGFQGAGAISAAQKMEGHRIPYL